MSARQGNNRFTMRTLGDVPPATGKRPMGWRAPLTQALIDLAQGQALFVEPADGQSLQNLGKALGSLRMRHNLAFSTRADRKRKGVWVYPKADKNGAEP